MEKQVSITKYFKSKNPKPRPCIMMKMSNSQNKKIYNSSLKSTPTKSIETSEIRSVIDLTSDSSLSDSTMVISPELDIKTPNISSSLTPNLKRSPLSVSSDGTFDSISYSRTPSKREYYSPSKKKKYMAQTTPVKAKRNLNHLLTQNIDYIFRNEELLDLCAGLDDKTMFLITIIYQFLQDENMKSLLENKSIKLLENCLYIMKPGMHLVCRLFWRQDRWQRLDNIEKILNNSNIMNNSIMEIINSLVENGYLTVCNVNNVPVEMTFDDIVAILKLDALKEICKELNIKKIKNKEVIIQKLKEFQSQKVNITNFLQGPKSNNEMRLMKVLSAKLGVCYKLSDEARTTLKELYLLMYLGINKSILIEKKLELMLINYKANIENYPINKDMDTDNASVVFKNRDQFKFYVDAMGIYESFLEDTKSQSRDKKCLIVKKVYNLYKSIDQESVKSYMLLPSWLHRFTAPYLYVKILDESIKELKKEKTQKYITLAVDILSTLISQNVWKQHKKADWYAEKALILDRLLNKPEEAALLLLEGFRSSLNETCKDVLRPRALVLANRKVNAISGVTKTQLLEFASKEDILEKNIPSTHFYQQPLENNKKGKTLFKIRTSNDVRVCDAEQCCIQLYIEKGLYTHGEHWEGKIALIVFFLLFWDIIYQKPRGVRGIFLSHYQMYPLDMFTESFYTNRKTLIEDRLKQIESYSVEEMLKEMKAVFDSRPENELSPVRGARWESVAGAGAALGGGGCARLCAALLARSAAGFPDLTLWHRARGEIAFVEVKTDNDKPSLKQLQWMHYLKQNNIHTEFCYIGVNTLRQQSRNTGYSTS